MSHYNLHRLIAFGPHANADRFLSEFRSVAAGIVRIRETEFYDYFPAITHLVVEFYVLEQLSVTKLYDLIPQFPTLRFAATVRFESAYYKTFVLRHRHGLGYNRSLVDDRYGEHSVDFPIIWRDDLIDDLRSDDELAYAFRLLGYPLESLLSDHLELELDMAAQASRWGATIFAGKSA